MGTRLFVGNIPFKATEDDVRRVFEVHGSVKDCHIVIDRDSNKPKGFCFVEMGTDEEARTAIEKTHGLDMDGRPLNVSEARPRAERPSGGGGSNRW